MKNQSWTSDRERIRELVSNLKPGNQRRYGKELRSDIQRYLQRRKKTGASRVEISRELGVSAGTLANLDAENIKSTLREVRVKRTNRNSKQEPKILVHGPNGILIEGLDLENVATLFRALSC